MIDAWKKSGKKFTIGYQNRFRPEVQALHAACEAGELGEILRQSPCDSSSCRSDLGRIPEQGFRRAAGR